MRIYADTSWWLGCKCRRDTHHSAALSLFDREPDALLSFDADQLKLAEAAGLPVLKL